MKNIVKFILFLPAVVILYSCGEDFLNVTPDDRITADNFYRNESEVRQGTASLYGYPWFNFTDKFFWLAGDEMAGNIYYTYTAEGQFFRFTIEQGNEHLLNGWISLFRVISYANSIINDMPSSAKGKVSQDVIDAALGEARFIRAVAYFMLAEFWGEVPIVENSTALVTSNELILPKNTHENVYEFIKRDLIFAGANLKESDDPGRVTLWSAKAMLAKLYLTIAQYNVLKNTDTSDVYFAKAMQYSDDVIQNSGHKLMEDYHDLFMIENNNNEESVFAIQYIKGGYGFGSSLQTNWARSSVIAAQSWGSGKGVTVDFMDDVESGDLRRRSIYMQEGDFYPELNKAEGGYYYNLVTLDPGNPDSEIESPNEVLNHLKKYIVGLPEDNNGNVGTDQDAGINQYILRFAEMYLIYAEASIGRDTVTTDSKAIGYFNEVRKRAGLLERTDRITYMNVLKERRVEFCLESSFWFDVKRFYYRDPSGALNYINTQRREDTYTLSDGGERGNKNDYTLQPPTSPIKASESDMVLPIPESEVIANPLFKEAAVEYEFK